MRREISSSFAHSPLLHLLVDNFPLFGAEQVAYSGGVVENNADKNAQNESEQ